MSQINDVKTVRLLGLVSKRWHELSHDKEVWKSLYLTKWGTHTPRPTYLKLLKQQRPWTSLYENRVLLEKNWKGGEVSARYINGHIDSVYCIQFDKDRILSGSRDRTIKSWDVHTGECMRTLEGHAGSVLCLQYDSRYIVTGSSDASIIIWDFETGKKLRTLRGHASPVLDVRFDEKEQIIVSCSKDCTIKVWNIVTGRLLRTLIGHHAAVNAVHLHENLVVSASGDCYVKLWDVNTGKCLRDFTGHTRGLACVQFDGKTIMYVLCCLQHTGVAENQGSQVVPMSIELTNFI